MGCHLDGNWPTAAFAIEGARTNYSKRAGCDETECRALTPSPIWKPRSAIDHNWYGRRLSTCGVYIKGKSSDRGLQMSGKPSMHPARNESVDTDTPRIARIFWRWVISRGVRPGRSSHSSNPQLHC